MRNCILAEPAGLSTTLAHERDELVAGSDERDAPRQADPQYSVEWRGLLELRAIVPQWRALIAGALEPNVFYDPAFALSAAPVFGTDAGALVVWSGDAPRRLVGLLPATVARRRYLVSLPVLAGWTHAYAPLGVALVARDAADAAIEALLDHVERDPGLPKTRCSRSSPSRARSQRHCGVRSPDAAEPLRHSIATRARNCCRVSPGRTTSSVPSVPSAARRCAGSAGVWRSVRR